MVTITLIFGSDIVGVEKFYQDMIEKQRRLEKKLQSNLKTIQCGTLKQRQVNQYWHFHIYNPANKVGISKRNNVEVIDLSFESTISGASITKSTLHSP